MRQPRALFGRGLRRSQIHAAIDGDRITTDNLATKAFAQRQRQRCLAAARRAEQQDDERVWLRRCGAWRVGQVPPEDLSRLDYPILRRLTIYKASRTWVQRLWFSRVTDATSPEERSTLDWCGRATK